VCWRENSRLSLPNACLNFTPLHGSVPAMMKTAGINIRKEKS